MDSLVPIRAPNLRSIQLLERVSLQLERGDDRE